MSAKQNKYFSRRSFLATGAMACASGLALKGYGSTGADLGPKSSYGKIGSSGPDLMGQLAHGYSPDKRTHPAEGLARENIVITVIKVTPLSYVAPKDKYLWRVGGLVVWKSDAALVQVLTNKGIIGIGEGSPYCVPDKIKEYTDTIITDNGKQVEENNTSIESDGKDIAFFCSEEVLKQYGLQPTPLQEIGPKNNRWVD